ncbi:MAG: hypothetical protein JXA01_01855 [Dehalococcoidia bacterium]|nr:hypothetical protein [Dehalococcoidia bacterium]
MRIRSGIALLILIALTAVPLTGCIYIPGEIPTISFMPVVQSFESSPTVITAGEHSTLSWSVTGATKVYIDNNVGNVAMKGNITVSPGSTTQYTLTASNSSGSSTARTQVIVNTPAQTQTQTQMLPPTILTFYADKTYVSAGEAVTLYWTTSEATAAALDPVGAVSPEGNQTVYPYATTDYVLTASNSYGIARHQLTVYVNTPVGGQSTSEQVIVLSSIPGESGALVKNNMVYTLQDTACIGDTTLNLASRAFLSFNISGVPSNAVIHEAVLDLSSYTQTGNPTYSSTMWGNMGAIEVYFYQYGDSSNLDTMAYNRPGTLASGGNITSYPSSPWHVDVSIASTGEKALQNLVQSGQPRCQFRIQFFTSTNWDSTSDMFCFDDAKLIIKYTTP